MTMQNSSTGEASSSAPRGTGQRSHELLTCTIKTPPYSYVRLELVVDSPQLHEAAEGLDNIQVRSYCTAALRQFLGATGSAIPVDILKVDGNQCWLRVPRPDLSPFAAAITAWAGVTEQGGRRVLQVKQCSDYLGAMAGAEGQDKLWSP
ncbi:hypothetical protein CGRA01v4_03204 [Colletotrichum graminicola]|uniref:Ribonucleases P/MRP subunit Pop8-like domain-containing protein n=1 Tax=Colletotrichum graminicola (strain M1.001 / M2 / FGSC 10212) TaxID=645133 RepID=E3QB55_COLGM|nr:uncharacterized protein GLRG_03237 [Colletotrichum graminicola M1.001]EFQ28093.1 hypothetical protein GLRG_03237 [Colletotrichum graminicola M1.001]WDK11925.1 hypothetical protein CGRA01v4_03204 [Colletotrichum graminicola]